MKNYALPILLCAVLGYASNAQKLSLVPYMGHEYSKTFLSYNSMASFIPKDKQLAPSFGVRLDYAFKKFGGPYVGLATSRSSVAVNFSDPEAGMNITNVSTGKMQLRLEGGYKISSKPIYFKKPGTAAVKPAAAPQVQSAAKSRCGGYCAKYRSMTNAASARSVAAPDKGWSMSIQPAAGMAFIPAVKSDVSTQTQGNKASVSYVAGNWSSAVTAGAGFEFAKNDQKRFVVGVQYLKGIGNLNDRAVATSTGSKSTTTMLGSSVSGVNISVGIPISLTKKKAVAKPVEIKPVIEQPKPVEQKKTSTERRCGRYYSSYQ